MHPDKNAPPFNPLPGVVWLLVLPLVAVEAWLSLGEAGLFGGPGAIGWRTGAVRDFGFSDAVFEWIRENRSYPPELLLRFVSYGFVHWSFTHALLAVVLALALGKFVGEVFRPWAVLAVYYGAGIAGALAYGLLIDSPLILIGAYPAVYGLIGAFTFILWARLGAERADRRRAFLMIGFLMAIQFAFGLVNWIFYASANFLWVAELAGFGAGFALSFVVSPGGWAAVLARLRQP